MGPEVPARTTSPPTKPPISRRDGRLIAEASGRPMAAEGRVQFISSISDGASGAPSEMPYSLSLR